MAINHIIKAPALGVRNGLADVNWTFDELQTYSRAYPGMVFPFQGNLYQVVQNRHGSDITVGQAVSLLIGDASRTGNLTGASTKAVVTTDDTLDANLKGSRVFPGRIFTTATALATTEDMEEREILSNTTTASASTVTVAQYDRSQGPNESATTSVDAYSATPDANWDYAVFAGWEVVLADIDAIATSAVQGIVVSTTISDNKFGIVQIAGIAMAEVDGTTDLVAGDPVRAGGTAGVLVKHTYTGGGATGAEALNGDFICGRILNAYTADAAGRRAIQLRTPWTLIPFPITD